MSNNTKSNEIVRRGVVDILRLNPNIPEDWEIRDREYNAVDIDKVVIDGDTFTNYGDFQFVWEKSYVTGSFIHGIFQARILEWVAISLSRGSSGPRD